ncbi:MAG TPA: NHL repeat-containing protein, partial [Chloroflexota bacterium]
NGLAVDANDNVYAADTGRNRILVFSPAGRLMSQVGHGGTDLGGFTQPMMLAFGPDGSLFVADWENGRITRWAADLVATDAWSTGFRPFGVAVDQSGRVFVPDTEHRRVEAYSPRGEPLGEMGGPGSPIIDVTPKQVAVPRRGGQTALYVLGSDGIQRLDLEDTPAPPPSSADTDVFGVVAMALMLALLGLAVALRRRRRSAALLGAPPGRPVRLHAENGAESQYQQPCTDQNLLLAHEPERE